MNLNKANERATVEAELFVWMAIHGNVLLALRHPHNTGPSSAVLRDFCDNLGNMLVETGLLTQAELDYTNKVEREHRARHAQ